MADNDLKIEKLGLSPRTVNALGRAGIHDVEQLRQLNEKDLRMLRGIGDKCLREITAKLQMLKNREAEDSSLAFAENENYTAGYWDGVAAMRYETFLKLQDMAKSTRGTQGAALQVAAQVVMKLEVPCGKTGTG